MARGMKKRRAGWLDFKGVDDSGQSVLINPTIIYILLNSGPTPHPYSL
jgi:hypothetical protein